jgi:ATP-binding cassette, subfamily C (CFTR/MRP), member 1
MGATQVPLTAVVKPPSFFEIQRHHHEPLCGNPEGWGPISHIRYDFTPCFLDIWVVFVATWGVLGGAGALWYLLKKKIPQDVPRNWHFYTKL